MSGRYTGTRSDHDATANCRSPRSFTFSKALMGPAVWAGVRVQRYQIGLNPVLTCPLALSSTAVTGTHCNDTAVCPLPVASGLGASCAVFQAKCALNLQLELELAPPAASGKAVTVQRQSHDGRIMIANTAQLALAASGQPHWHSTGSDAATSVESSRTAVRRCSNPSRVMPVPL
jgi:hypothetical protein